MIAISRRPVIRIFFFILIFAASPGVTLNARAAGPFSAAHPLPQEHLDQLGRLHALAESQIVQNDFQAAIRTYSDILLLEPDDETAYTGLGQVYLVLGDYERARDAYLNALHINPDNETAMRGLQKIVDPDSVDFAENKAAAAAETPAAKLLPDRHAPPDYLRGAQKTMASYSTELPERFRSFSRGQLIQAALKNAGYYQGAVDGKFGQMTATAIKEFQKANGLKADGVIGEQTWIKLSEYLQ